MTAGAFMYDVEEIKPGLIVFRRRDVKHRNFYCRIKVPHQNRYKIVSLKTPETVTAHARALEEDADLRFRLKHDIPVFGRLFSEIATDFAAFQKERATAGQITMHRWRVIESHIRVQLNRYVGNMQITSIGQDKWKEYPIWRQANGKGRSGGLVSDGTVRDEMSTFKSIMAYAASKKYISESQVFKDKLPVNRAARDEFTPEEYRQLHTFARGWVKRGATQFHRWYRSTCVGRLSAERGVGIFLPVYLSLMLRHHERPYGDCGDRTDNNYSTHRRF